MRREEGFLASRAGLRPVSVRNDQEEMLRIGRDVGLPKVLEVVVVRRRPTSLYLGEDPATRAEPIVEVGAGCGDEAVLRRNTTSSRTPSCSRSSSETIFCTALLGALWT